MPVNHNTVSRSQSQLIGKRIKSERKRLNLTQSDVSKILGIKRETWNRYESGKLLPGFNALARLSKAGADVLYILTGERFQNYLEVVNHNEANSLNGDERLYPATEDLTADQVWDLFKFVKKYGKEVDYLSNFHNGLESVGIFISDSEESWTVFLKNSWPVAAMYDCSCGYYNEFFEK